MRLNDRKKVLHAIFQKKAFFNLSAGSTYADFFTSYFHACLKADLADHGDVTTVLLRESLPSEIEARFVAKSGGVFSGEEEVAHVAKTMGLNVRKVLRAGKRFKKGDVLFRLEGDACKILEVERTLLNLLQRMCGIATAASQFKTIHASIAVTRKTPLSFIDKRAAMDGGALAHRINLSDAILIKDTHLDQFGRDFKIVEKRLTDGRKTDLFSRISFVEVEVENAKEALCVAAMSVRLDLPVPFVIMLDNFTPAHIKKTVAALQKAGLYDCVLLEVSGGINAKNYKKYDIKGVDVMSVGEITHSVKACDISMKIMYTPSHADVCGRLPGRPFRGR